MAQNVHIPFITVRFGSTSFTWRADQTGSRPDYFTSLEHERPAEEAGRITFNFTYCPHVGEDPNRLERAIVGAKGVGYFQYGDLGSSTNLYKMLVYSYSVSFSSGSLLYNLKAISKSVIYEGTEKLPGFHNSPGYKNSSYASCERNVARYLTGYFSSTINVKNLIKSDYEFNADNVLRALKDDCDMSCILNMSVPDNLGPFEGLKSIASQMIPKENPDKAYYVLVVDDRTLSGGKGKVSIEKVSTDSPSVAYNFNWGTKDGQVLSWNPEYDGQYAIYKARGEPSYTTTVQKDGTFMTIQTDVPTAANTFSGVYSSEELSRAIESESEFAKKASYNYKGTLTVLGKGTALTIGKSAITINPLVMGQSHHSAGTYIILSVKDSVSSQGFTTTYTVYRKPDSGVYDTSVSPGVVKETGLPAKTFRNYEVKGYDK